MLARGKSGRDVAEACGVSEPTVSRWRKDKDFAHTLDRQRRAFLRGELQDKEETKTEGDEWREMVARAKIINLTLRDPQLRIVEAFDAGSSTAVFSGGNGAGKSFLALREALETCWGLKAWAPELSTVKIVGESWPQLSQVFQEYVKLYIPDELVESYGDKVKGLRSSFTFKNGSTLNFGTLEQGVSKHQGQRCNLIIYDEEPTYDIYEEGCARMSRQGKAPKILFTMTPTKGKGWVWDELICLRKEKRVTWETCSIFENGEGTCGACNTTRGEWDAILRNLRLERDPAEYPILGGRWLNLQLDAFANERFSRAEGYCHRCWTFGLEPFAEREFIRRQLDNPNKKRIAMRLLGSWENLDGSALFDNDHLSALSAYTSHPKVDDGYALQIWDEPRPGHPYVIGVDPARGTGRDETVFQVLDASTGQQAACWAHNEERVLGQFQALKSLARRYHGAFTVIEYASSGEGLIPMAEEDGSFPLYHKPSKNKAGEWVFAASPGIVPMRDRSKCLTKMITAIRKGLVKDPHTDKWQVVPGRAGALYIQDAETVRQLARMFYDEDGKIDSPKGGSSHDDRVLSLAFAWEGVRHPSVSNTPRKLKKRNALDKIRREYQKNAYTAQRSRNPWARR
jgi:phage terminase large subunit-like protein/transcriptional regulator with XRE-family HTH domain